MAFGPVRLGEQRVQVFHARFVAHQDRDLVRPARGAGIDQRIDLRNVVYPPGAGKARKQRRKNPGQHARVLVGAVVVEPAES